AFLAGLVLVAAGCRWGGIMGNGHIVTDTRSVTDFSEIEANGGFQIEWRSGPPSLSITTDENLLRYIDNQNIDRRLRLRSHGNIWSSHGIKVAISSSTRSGAKLTGAARLTTKQLSGRSFGIESTGAAKVFLDGTVDDLVTDMTGASRFEAEAPHLLGIGTEPEFAIGQRALLLQLPHGNLLWDCISLLDDKTVAEVKARGGIRAIAISHPHFYSSMVEWAERFDAQIFLHAKDRQWAMRQSPRIQFWDETTLPLWD